MFDQLKKDRHQGFAAQERLRLSLYVAGMLALGGFIVVGATTGEKAPEKAVDAEARAEMDPGPLLDPAVLRDRVDGTKPERWATDGIEYVRKIRRTGRLGPVTRRLSASEMDALDGPGAVIEVRGRVIDVSREEYRSGPDTSADERLWSVVLEDGDGSQVVAIKHGRGSDFAEGAPVDAKPPMVRSTPIAPGQHVVVRGVYLQDRTGTLGRTVLRSPTPVVFASKFRIEIPPENRPPPISSLDDALWSEVRDRFNRESRNWEEDALFEVVQWARMQGYEKVRKAVLEGELGWKEWGKQTFDTWKKEVAVDTRDAPRPFTDGARGKVFRVSGIVAEVLQYGWERITPNAWGVDEFQLLTLMSDHYRNVVLRMVLPYPITTFEGVTGTRTEHLRLYGVFIKNNTYDTQFDSPDGSGRPHPITVPLFVVFHAEQYPEDEASRGMRNLMIWVAGVMVFLGILFYIVLIRGGQKQAERMEAHRWELRRRARAAGDGPTAGPPAGRPASDPGAVDAPDGSD